MPVSLLALSPVWARASSCWGEHAKNELNSEKEDSAGAKSTLADSETGMPPKNKIRHILLPHSTQQNTQCA